MNDDELAAIKARTDAATPGPWLIGGAWPGRDAILAMLSVRDARFAAAARDDVPALLAEIARLRELVKALIIRPEEPHWRTDGFPPYVWERSTEGFICAWCCEDKGKPHDADCPWLWAQQAVGPT